MAIALYKSWVMQVTWGAGASSLQALMNTAVAWKGDAALNANVSYVQIQPEGAIRFTIDWQTPTASVGMIGVANTIYEIESTVDKIIIIWAQKVNITTWRKSLV